MDIYLVRHGKTQWNIERRLQGITDTELHLEGFEDARVMGEYLKDKDIKQIFSSPLRRTLDTAKVINQALRLDIETDDRLVERDFKEYSGYLVEDFIKLTEEEKHKIEAVDDVVARGLSFYQEKIKHIQEPTVVVTHGGLLGLVLGHLNLLESGSKIKHRCIYRLYGDANSLMLEEINLNAIQPAGFALKMIESEAEIDAALAIYQTQPEYFELSSQRLPTRQDVLNDRIEMPPNTDLKNKKYQMVTYYDEPVAVLDYIEHYPTQDCVYIGFLIRNRDLVLSVSGSEIMKWLIQEFQKQSFRMIRLGVLEENVAAYRFWKRLGFNEIDQKKIVMNEIEHRVLVLEYDLVG